jgi:hypothetical protein
MTAVEFARLVKGARRRRGSDWWDARCPAHNDRRASLSFADGDVSLVLNCHAGCPREKIAAAVGLRPEDLSRRPSSSSEIAATYSYRDERGELLYEVVRFQPKTFRPRRPDGRGGWLWNLDGVRRVVYRLDELAEQRRVFLVEGEKDADRLTAMGLPATTTPGGASAWRDDYADQIAAAGVEEVVAIPDNDEPGRAYVRTAATALKQRGVAVRVLELPVPPKGDVSDWLDAGHTRDELLTLAASAPGVIAATPTPAPDSREPQLTREGLDVTLAWPDGARFQLSAVRDGREGVRGELTVTLGARRLSWGVFSLSSTQARETLRKKLEAAAPGVPWREYLEEAAWRLTRAARQGEPLEPLTGLPEPPGRELVPRLLYEGEPTLVYGDGDTGKSLFAMALAVAVHAGVALPFGLRPTRAVPVAYLDWETSRTTADARLGLLAAGLGVDPPPILYRRMRRPLAEEAEELAGDLARHRVGLVVIDSQMFAVAASDGAPVHEPLTTFYTALRLLGPVASLIVSHVTGADARSGGPARPYGGAFAFNGPRLVWEARRDPEVTDATAIAFACRKANNLPQRPEPFGLRFVPTAGAITVYPLDLAEAAPQTLAGTTLTYRLHLALANGPLGAPELAEAVGSAEPTVAALLRRLRQRGLVVRRDDGTWALATPRCSP